MSARVLLEKVNLGSFELANRLVMAPMTRSRANDDGTANSLIATYYSQRAAAGLIVSESIYVSAGGKSAVNTPGLHAEAHVSSWQPVTDAVHRAGGLIFAQLAHAGRVSHQDLLPAGEPPVAPSAITCPFQTFTTAGLTDCSQPRALATSEIKEVVESFARAAKTALAAGFDGVEIHGGNGYLVNQFLCLTANQRDDAYGGSIANRIRFVLEVTDAVAAAVGPDLVGIRLAPLNTAFGVDPADDGALYPALVSALPPDLAYLHIRETRDRGLTCRLRRLWAGSLILNPHPAGPDAGPATAAMAESAVAGGIADAASLGALFIANPDLPARIAQDGPYISPERRTYYWGGESGYTDYPALPR